MFYSSQVGCCLVLTLFEVLGLPLLDLEEQAEEEDEEEKQEAGKEDIEEEEGDKLSL